MRIRLRAIGPALGCAALVLLGGSSARAQVALTPTELDRTIRTQAIASTGLAFHSEVAGDGPVGSEAFDGAVLALAPTTDATAQGSASQRSEILASSLQGEGQVSADVAIGAGASDALGSAEGETTCRTVFDVDTPVVMILGGQIEASPSPAVGDTFAIVEIVEADSLAVLASFSVGDDQSATFSQGVALVPGTDYEVFARALATSEARAPGPTNEAGTAGFTFTLEEDPDGDGIAPALDNCSDVANGPLAGTSDQSDADADGYGDPCDCDFDGDGTCDIADFQIFLADFIAQQDSGVGTDMNGDGVVDVSDFQAFLAGFLRGGPGPSGLVP